MAPSMEWEHLRLEFYKLTVTSFIQKGQTGTIIPNVFSAASDFQSGFKSISMGKSGVVGLKDDNTVYCIGDNKVITKNLIFIWKYGTCGLGHSNGVMKITQISNMVNITQVSAGDYHTLLLAVDGQVYSFGQGGSGKLGHGNAFNQNTPKAISGFNDIISASAGYYHSIILRNDSTAWCKIFEFVIESYF